MIDEMLMQMYFNIVSILTRALSDSDIFVGVHVTLLESLCYFVLCHTIYKDTKDLHVNGTILCQSKSWPKIKIQYK